MNIKSILEKIVGKEIEPVDVEMTEKEKVGAKQLEFRKFLVTFGVIMGIGLGVVIGMGWTALFPNMMIGEIIFSMKLISFIVIISWMLTIFLGFTIAGINKMKLEKWKEENKSMLEENAILTDKRKKKIHLHQGNYINTMKKGMYTMVFFLLTGVSALILVLSGMGFEAFKTPVITLLILSMITLVYYFTNEIKKTYKKRQEALEELEHPREKEDITNLAEEDDIDLVRESNNDN